MSGARGPGGTRRRRGSAPNERAAWRATYERTPFSDLPWFQPGPSSAVRAAVESRFLTPDADVLDVGCGAGSNVLYLAQQGFRAQGIDLAPGAVDAAQRRAAESGLDAVFREGDALALPFEDGSVGSIIDNGCFHTLPLARRPRYAEEVHRVLRPAGRFVLSWVAREHTGERGPPHRPSLSEVTDLLESRFLFVRTGFESAREGEYPSTYFAFLARRTEPYPRRR